jgi:hypothetical protein
MATSWISWLMPTMLSAIVARTISPISRQGAE